MSPFLQHLFANMHQHPKVQRFFAIHIHGCSYMGCGFIKLAQQTENAGQVEVCMVIIRGQIHHSAAEQKSQRELRILAQTDAEISEHVLVRGADVFGCLRKLFQSAQRGLAFARTPEAQQGLTKGFAQARLCLLYTSRCV